MEYKEQTNCRVCDSDKLTPYLDLGNLPLSNNLCENATEHVNRYPLKVLLCQDCGLSQLSIVIPPEVMFSHYVYRSSISKGYKDHCRQMAIDLKEKYSLNENSFHIDIAGNDGALLNEFKQVIGHRVLNIDPALNLLRHNASMNIPTWPAFWNIKTAEMVVTRFTGSSKSGEEKPDPLADLITATNVFAHVDNVKEFISAVKLVLKPTGVLVMEFPYLIDFIENGEFDTVYFEHLSYFSIYPLTLLFESLGLNVMNVQHKDIHGGSVRVTIGYGKEDKTVRGYVINEIENYSDIKRYHDFSDDVMLSIENFKAGILGLKGKVAGFAASAKGNTLLNCAGITKELLYIADQTPEKIGKYSPGTGIKIVSLADMISNQPDYLVVLSWNFLDEIKDKCRLMGYKGKFIVPIPEFKIID